MKPEEKARQNIDRLLQSAGWKLQDMSSVDLSAGIGVAIREFPLDTGFADYLLFLNDKTARGISRRDSGEPSNSTRAVYGDISGFRG